MKNHKNHLGMTLFELMLALAVVAILYNTITTQYYQFAQIARSRTYATLNKAFAQEYSNYIEDHYDAIWNLMGNQNRAVIPYSTLQASGYANESMYIQGQFAPCAIILADQSSKMLFPLIVDVTNNLQLSANLRDSMIGVGYLGSFAAYYNNGIFNGYGGWSINQINSPYFSGSNPLTSCDYNFLVQNSIATNLVLSTFFTQHVHDIGLSRSPDISDTGFQNLNVAKTNIVLGYNNMPNPLSYNKIFFAAGNLISTNPYCIDGNGLSNTSPYYSGNNIVCPNSDLIAGSLLNEGQATLNGNSCSPLGQIMMENSDRHIQNTLTCTYSPVVCSLLANAPRSSCYLPNIPDTVKLYVSGLTATYACPNPTPIAIDATSNTQTLTLTICQGSDISQCSGSNIFTTIARYNNLTAQTPTLLFTSSVNTLAGNVTAYTGATSITMPNLTTAINNQANCNNICTLIFNETSGTASSNACSCNLNSQTNFFITNIKAVGNINLNYLTCSNKNSIGL